MKLMLSMEINSTLVDDLKKCAHHCSQPLDKFIAEILEAYVAQRRIDKNVPEIHIGNFRQIIDTEELVKQ